VNTLIHQAASTLVGSNAANGTAALWLEKETRKLYGTATKIGASFPVRLFSDSRLRIEQGVEWIIHCLTPTCNEQLAHYVAVDSSDLNSLLQDSYMELFETFFQDCPR